MATSAAPEPSPRQAVVRYLRSTPPSCWLAVVGALAMIASAVQLAIFAPPEQGAQPWGFTLYVFWYLAIALFLHSPHWYVKAPGLLMLLATTALLVRVGIPRYGLFTWFGAVALLNIITVVVALAELAWPRRLVPPRLAHR